MTALIIGGGIAGCAAALALHRAGIDSTIYEARPGPSDGVGAFLTLAVNGVAALAELGVDARDAGGIPTPQMQIALSDGAPITRFPLGDGTLSVRRSALYGLLQNAVGAAGIPLHYGHRVTDVVGTTACFENGSTATADVLIGADGLGSRVRAALDPRAPRARYLGLLNTGGFSRGVEVPTEPGVMHMMFGSQTFFSWLAGADGEVWWFANPASKLERPPARDWRASLVAMLADDHPVAARVVAACDEVLAPWPMHDFPRVPVWHRDRAVIIGDAAHAASPSSGQGASMAIEDAVALGRLLGALPVDDALVAFEQLRRPRVEKVIKQGERSSSGKTPGRLGRAIRDRSMRWYFSKPRGATDQSWLWEYRVSDEVDAALARYVTRR